MQFDFLAALSADLRYRSPAATQAKNEPQGEVWLQTIFCSAWLRYFKHSEDLGPFLELNLSLCQYLDRQKQTWHPRLQAFAEVAHNTAKGFVALLSPVPGLAGSGLEHVEYLHSTRSKAKVATELPVAGKTIAAKLRLQTNDNVWKGTAVTPESDS